MLRNTVFSTVVLLACMALLTAPVLADAPASFSSKGLNLSHLSWKPSVKVTESYDDNIFTSEARTSTDFITHVMPRLDVVSVDSPHQFKFSAGVDQTLYADHSDVNYFDYDVGVRDKYNITPTLRWNVDVGYRKGHSLPGDDVANPAANAGEALPYNIYHVNNSLTKNIGALNLAPRVNVTRFDYEDVRDTVGTLIDEDFRDRAQYVVGGRVSYALNKQFAPYIDAEFIPIKYDEGSVGARDSRGGTGMVGLKYTARRDMTVDAGVGQMSRDYVDRLYDDIYALAAKILTTWDYDTGSRLSLGYNRSMVEVTDGGVGGAVMNELTANITRQFSEQLSGNIKGAYRNYDYQGGHGASNGVDNRVDHFWRASLGLEYEVQENLIFTGDYAHIDQDSNRDTSDYNKNVVMLGVRGAF